MSFLTNLETNALKNIKTNASKGLSSTLTSFASNLNGALSQYGITGPIGTLGDLVFEASTSTIRTFDDYKRNTKARIATHELIGRKPILEFLGPDVEEITFNMKFYVFFGVNPTAEVQKLRKSCSNGEVMNFILNNQPVGDNKWLIESVGEAVTAWDNMGNIIRSSVDVTLKEYVDSLEGA